MASIIFLPIDLDGTHIGKVDRCGIQPTAASHQEIHLPSDPAPKTYQHGNVMTRVQVPATRADERLQTRSSYPWTHSKGLRTRKGDWSVRPPPFHLSKSVRPSLLFSRVRRHESKERYIRRIPDDYKRKTRTRRKLRVKFRDTIPCNRSISQARWPPSHNDPHATCLLGPGRPRAATCRARPDWMRLRGHKDIPFGKWESEDCRGGVVRVL